MKTTHKPYSSSEAELDEILEPFAVYLRNHEVGADKVILKQAISELLTQARVEELEKLSKSKWADLAYDIPFYLKDRLTELRKVKQMAISTEAKIEASKCQDCGEVNYPEWTLLPHERFNKICPNVAGLLCLSFFSKKLLNKPPNNNSY